MTPVARTLKGQSYFVRMGQISRARQGQTAVAFPHAIIPKEIASKSIDIHDDIAFVLKNLLDKSTDGMDRENKENIFDSSKIY